MSGSDSLFVPTLATAGVLSEKTFSIYYGGVSTASYLDFGAPNAAIVGDFSKTTWITTKNDEDKWASEIKGFRWGAGEASPDEQTYTSMEGYLDAALPCIYGPKTYVDPII